MRPTTRRSARRSGTPTGRGSAKPCAASAIRRAWARVSDSVGGTAPILPDRPGSTARDYSPGGNAYCTGMAGGVPR